jgi:hypothetical protein
VEVFQREHVVLLEQHERRLVMNVGTLTMDLLMLALQQVYGLAASPAALLAPRDAPLGLLELFLRSAIVARVLYDLAIRRDQKYFEANEGVS